MSIVCLRSANCRSPSPARRARRALRRRHRSSSCRSSLPCARSIAALASMTCGSATFTRSSSFFCFSASGPRRAWRRALRRAAASRARTSSTRSRMPRWRSRERRAAHPRRNDRGLLVRVELLRVDLARPRRSPAAAAARRRDFAQDRDRIEQLLARALERDERGLGARDAVLGGEVLQLAPRLGDLRLRLEQVDVEVLELTTSRIFSSSVRLSSAFLRDRRRSRRRGEVADRRRPRRRCRALCRRGASSVPCCASGSVPPASLDRDPRSRAPRRGRRAARRSARRAAPRACPRPCAARRTATARARARSRGSPSCPRRPCAGAPRRRTTTPPARVELERLREVGVLAGLQLLGVRGVGHAEVVRGAEPQLGIDAGRAARIEQRLLGRFVVALDEQRRRLRCTSRAPRGARRAQHGRRRSASDATTSALIASSDRLVRRPTAPRAARRARASTSHGYRSAGITRTDAVGGRRARSAARGSP